MPWRRAEPLVPIPISLWSSFCDLCYSGGASSWPRLVLSLPRTILGWSLHPTANLREHQHPLGGGYELHPQSSDSVGFKFRWKISISNKLTEADTIGLGGQGPSSETIQLVYSYMSWEWHTTWKSFLTSGGLGGTLEMQPWEAPLWNLNAHWSLKDIQL